MVGEVNKIIFNMLISGRGVYMPQIGTLYIERQGARKISEHRLLSPRNVVRFTTQEQEPSLVDEIVKIASCERTQADDIYSRWLAKTQEGNTVTIESIGKLTDKSFAAEESFKKTINPEGVKTIIVRRRRKSHTWLYVLSGVCVAIALGILAYLLWGEGPTAPQPAATPVTTPVTQTEVVAEPTDSLTTTAQATGQTTEQASAQPAEVAAPESKEYAHYVVMGIFANEDNAKRAAEQVASKIKDAACTIIPFKNKHMVTVFGSDSRADCNTFAASYRDIYPDLWIYDKK